MNIQDTLNERGSRYGDFSVHARIAQALQDDMRCTEGWERLNDSQRQALTVIADKIARILSGDPDYADNWHDIQGYARLVEERLPVQEITGDGSGEALPEMVISCLACGSSPNNHQPGCPSQQGIGANGEVFGVRICTCGSTVDGQPLACQEHPGKSHQSAWTEWDGHDQCPFVPGPLLQVMTRDGDILTGWRAGGAKWLHRGISPIDVVAYRNQTHG
jgi:hypothetical protein